MPFTAALLLFAIQPLTPALPPTARAPVKAPATPGITRTDLQQEPLSFAGREAIQTRVDFAPGAVVPNHRHPGDELVYVLSGTLEYKVEGQPIQILREGEVLFIPKDTVHSAINVGMQAASELATYVVEKGKPLTEFVK
ncbi:MAG: cupin domain-containing protein [Sphingomonas sp.]|nr:cupin domain-containing protein [Sphingomonas sp.]MBW0007646.1 cupin domain-containing protein [Sphingomonas sp.]